MEKRTKYYNVVEVDEIQERDLGEAPFKNLVLERDVMYHRATRLEGPRVDLLAHRQFGNVYLWWYLLIVNNVMNPFEDILSGDLLTIPDPRDLYDFYDERKRLIL